MLRNWQLAITLQRNSEQSLHLQIVQAVIKEIRRGRLVAGDALPGTRALAGDLAVNRKTAVLAYDELLAQGWIETHPRRGAFVSAHLPTVDNPIDAPIIAVSASFPLALPQRSSLECAEAKWSNDGSARRISFSDGVPDTRLVPFNVLSRAFRHAIVSSSRANQLAYDDPRGNFHLRAAVAEMLRTERGMAVTEDQVCIVRGSQMGIYLTARVLAEQEGCVVLEELSYPPAREAFRSCGLDILYVAQDEQGMDLDHLEDLCKRHKVSAVYSTPHHQFPTTAMLPVDRRLRILELSIKYNFIIIEDDYDHEFHFSHSPMLPLASTETANRVIHIGSLSKVLAPGLRVGYLVAPKNVVDRCADEVMIIDRQGNAITELAVAEMMRDGEMKRHIRRVLKIYRERRDHAVNRVEELLPEANFSVPPGGLALWLRFAPNLDMRRIEEITRTHGVDILPGYLFSGQQKSVPALRLGYANMNSNEFDVGIEILAKAVKQTRAGDAG